MVASSSHSTDFLLEGDIVTQKEEPIDCVVNCFIDPEKNEMYVNVDAGKKVKLNIKHIDEMPTTLKESSTAEVCSDGRLRGFNNIQVEKEQDTTVEKFMEAQQLTMDTYDEEISALKKERDALNAKIDKVLAYIFDRLVDGGVFRYELDILQLFTMKEGEDYEVKSETVTRGAVPLYFGEILNRVELARERLGIPDSDTRGLNKAYYDIYEHDTRICPSRIVFRGGAHYDEEKEWVQTRHSDGAAFRIQKKDSD